MWSQLSGFETNSEAEAKTRDRQQVIANSELWRPELARRTRINTAPYQIEK
tara:strand:+ start:206 stop:358 length:153 start_codon:yes stop_codon:yes gene_type:complete